MTLKWIDYILLLGIVMLLLVGIFCLFYYFQEQKNECTSNPLIYGAKQMEKNYEADFSGIGYLNGFDENGIPKKGITITFNSTDLIYEDLRQTLTPKYTNSIK